MRITIELSEREARFADDEVASGRFATRDEVLSEGLFLPENIYANPRAFQGEKLDRLHAAWQEGIESGDAGPIDFEELKREARRRLAART